MKIHFAALFFVLYVSIPALAQTAPVVESSIQSPIPSVRGLEYRAATLLPERERFSDKPLTPTAHLWITPAQNGETARGIGWNGVVYEVATVGEIVDFRAEIEAFLKPGDADREFVWRSSFQFSANPVALQILRTTGAQDLAERAAVRLGREGDEKADYFRNLRDAGVTSFLNGQFSQAKRQLQTLLNVFPAPKQRGSRDLRPEATKFLADIARRETGTPRPNEEIAALIWDLQNVRAFQRFNPGDIGWTENIAVQKLVDAGDRAVEPLLDALENDQRLTLSARATLGDNPGDVGTVREAAKTTLELLLKRSYESQKWDSTPAQRNADIAAQMRADWAKMKNFAPVERIFQTLLQANETPQRLEEAARELVRIGPPYLSFNRRGAVPVPKVFAGEALRAHQNPSVSDLLQARIIELSARALTQRKTLESPNVSQLNRMIEIANDLAIMLSWWDSKRAASLLGAQLERTKNYAALHRRGAGVVLESIWETDNLVNSARRQFLHPRLNTPFRAAAMREYGEFLSRAPLGAFSHADYAPLWKFSGEKAMEKAALALFDAPKTFFQNAAQRKTGDYYDNAAFRLLSTPLVRTPLFQAAILRELKNQTVVGKLVATRTGEGEIRVAAWKRSDQTVKLASEKLENKGFQFLRVGDLVGASLFENRPDAQGHNRFFPLLDVSLPKIERDARLKEIAVLVAAEKVAVNENEF